MKSVLISINPKWCELIAKDYKTFEVKKTRPKCETPFKCYIYCTLGRPYLTDNGNSDYGYDLLRGYSREEAERIFGILNGKVIGEFICDNIDCVDIPYPAYQNKLDKKYIEKSCIRYYDLHRYAYHDNLYFWHISDLKIYDKPIELWEMCKPCNSESCEKCEYGVKGCNLTRPPQSWCYVEEYE